MEEPEFLFPRIDDQGHLPRLGEEVLVDEQVVARQENAEAGVRVLPADQRFGGKAAFSLAR